MTRNDIAAIATAAKEFVKAHKNRNKSYAFLTPNERASLEELERVIAEARSAV